MYDVVVNGKAWAIGGEESQNPERCKPRGKGGVQGSQDGLECEKRRGQSQMRGAMGPTY